MLRRMGEEGSMGSDDATPNYIAELACCDQEVAGLHSWRSKCSAG